MLWKTLKYKHVDLIRTLLTKDKFMLLSSLLALSPLFLVLILLLICKMSADSAGALGLALTICLAIFYFDTAPQIIPNLLLAAVLGSLPVGLVIAASILQVTIMGESGALGRIIALIKTLSPGDKAVQVLLINVSIGTLLTGLGAATMAIFPPILMALGYSVTASIILPSLGYLAFCMYALLGIPAVVMATFAGQSLLETGISLAAFMPIVSTSVALACLHVAGGFSLMLRGFWPAVLTGLSSGFIAIALAKMGLLTVTAVVSGAAVVPILLIYVKLRGGQVQDTSALTAKDAAAIEKFSLLHAASPWILLLVVSLILNTPSLPFFDIVFKNWSMPVDIIPGSPERIRLFWQAYFWVFLSTICCLPLLKVSPKAAGPMFAKAFQRGWRPVLATAIYFCIAYVMNHSGKLANWETVPQNNMILLIAEQATALFGTAYPMATPFLGLIAGFIGGSASSAVAMLTKLQVTAATAMGASPLTLVAANGIGGGLAGAISPSKVLSAAASIDKPEAAGSVMGYAFVLTVIVTAVCAIVTQWWAF